MTFLLLTHTFRPDLEFEAQYVSAVSAELTKRGHTVMMICGQGRISTALVRYSLQLSTPPQVDVVVALSSAPSVSRLGSLFARLTGARFKSRVVSAEVETVVSDLEAAREPRTETPAAPGIGQGHEWITPVASTAVQQAFSSAAYPAAQTHQGSLLATPSRPFVRGLAGRAGHLRVADRPAKPSQVAAERRSKAS